MPEMDGFQLCRKCKCDDALKEIPFIFYTAVYTSKKDEEFALKLGADGFITKPQDPDAFLKIIKAVIKDYSKKPIAVHEKSIGNEKVYLAEYNERLVKQLEKEMQELNEFTKKLKESEKKYSTLVEQGNDGIVIIQDNLIKFANSKILGLTGFSLEEALGKPFIEFISPEYVQMVMGRYKRRIAGEKVPNQYEIELISKTGGSIPVEINGSVIEYKGKIADMAIIRDITKRKKAEEELKQTAEDLARSNAEMETFVYSVAHDLRSPLRSMQGFSNALLEDYAKEMDPTAKDYAQRIVGASKRMDAMIQDLLSYSSVTRAKIELKPVNLESVIDDIREQWSPKIQESKAEINVKKPLQTVLGNPELVAQAIENLLSNALKFVAPGVKPYVKIYVEHPDQNRARLFVEDNGIGIDLNYHERIFQVFERLCGADEYPGTGIGLAIVSKGVERMGGKVGVESAPGKGSKFWIELPKA